MKPERITLSRAKGWRMPENTVKVDRTTVFGNPFQAGKDGDGSPEYLVGCFRKQMDRDKHEMPQEFYDWIAPLRGKNLACWCKQGQPCHADVLLELANA